MVKSEAKAAPSRAPRERSFTEAAAQHTIRYNLQGHDVMTTLRYDTIQEALDDLGDVMEDLAHLGLHPREVGLAALGELGERLVVARGCASMDGEHRPFIADGAPPRRSLPRAGRAATQAGRCR